MGVEDLHLKVSGGKGKGKADEDAEMGVEDADVPDEKAEERGNNLLEDSDESDADVPLANAHTEEDLPPAASGRLKIFSGRDERGLQRSTVLTSVAFSGANPSCPLVVTAPTPPLPRLALMIVSADMFFLEVPRSAGTMGETLFEHPQIELLTRVLNKLYQLRDINMDLRSASTKGSPSMGRIGEH
ncbi:hypothetical protein FA13DRAFT_1793999 [Coprinellus micaceus]|uniref:Uncharacterized protein n=1 Tax=Coprinellus micaceus TaxID=71717 RepID=A0A4Y7T333_COPMI|nr:hypothetical protein FA13DRAFT_1793999 [Coprinellus micaceus]